MDRLPINQQWTESTVTAEASSAGPAKSTLALDTPMSSSSARASEQPAATTSAESLQPKEHYWKIILADNPKITAAAMRKMVATKYNDMTTQGELKEWLQACVQR